MLGHNPEEFCRICQQIEIIMKEGNPGDGAHDADLAELVGRTNVHIFLVPR